MLFLMMLYRSCAKKNVTSKIAVMKFVSRLANPETGWPPPPSSLYLGGLCRYDDDREPNFHLTMVIIISFATIKFLTPLTTTTTQSS
jgi:hypothetical protein